MDSALHAEMRCPLGAGINTIIFYAPQLFLSLGVRPSACGSFLFTGSSATQNPSTSLIVSGDTLITFILHSFLCFAACRVTSRTR